MADEKLSTIRHSASHVMAAAVLQMFPDAKIAIGPSIENGFYYDFDLPRPLKMDDFPEIEERMRDIINKKEDFIRKEVSRAEALELFKDQPYKTELINDLPEDEVISIYTVDKFTDLCRGPHVENTKMINPQAIKLLSIAGAYWRGDEKRPMLQRIYATAFTNPKDLRLYLQHLEELAKRDHRKIGKELDLFHIDEENPGQIFWHPKGWTIYRTLVDYVRSKIDRKSVV